MPRQLPNQADIDREAREAVAKRGRGNPLGSKKKLIPMPALKYQGKVFPVCHSAPLPPLPAPSGNFRKKKEVREQSHLDKMS